MRMEGGWRGNSREDLSEGERLAAAMQEQIARVGQSLAVTTTGQGGNGTFAQNGNGALTRTIAFVPQPISASTLTRLQYEGVINIASGMTMDFVCAGGAAITSGDIIGPYQGATWLTIGTQPEVYAGVVLARHVIAQRQ